MGPPREQPLGAPCPDSSLHDTGAREGLPADKKRQSPQCRALEVLNLLSQVGACR